MTFGDRTSQENNKIKEITRQKVTGMQFGLLTATSVIRYIRVTWIRCDGKFSFAIINSQRRSKSPGNI